MQRIFIIGYMGAGKTTIGKILAQRLSLTFVDLDAHIQSRYHKTIPELFAEHSEEGFRKLEQQALHEVATFENVIVSTGGGTPCFFDNMDVMNRVGITVYIESLPEVLADRLLQSKSVRPLIAGKEKAELISFIAAHLAEREPFYRKATIIYHANDELTKEEVVLTADGIEKQLVHYFPRYFSSNLDFV